MKKSSNIGQKGEDLAARYLVDKGYSIRHRNFRSGRMEIDLIAETDDWLVFVEVKSRSDVKFGYPEEGLSTQQEDRIRTAAEHYLDQIEKPKRIRFDIIAIVWQPNIQIKHFEDAF